MVPNLMSGSGSANLHRFARLARAACLCVILAACNGANANIEKAQIAVRANPALELVATDERQGVVTVRVKSSGQTLGGHCDGHSERDRFPESGHGLGARSARFSRVRRRKSGSGGHAACGHLRSRRAAVSDKLRKRRDDWLLGQRCPDSTQSRETSVEVGGKGRHLSVGGSQRRGCHRDSRRRASRRRSITVQEYDQLARRTQRGSSCGPSSSGICPPLGRRRRDRGAFALLGRAIERPQELKAAAPRHGRHASASGPISFAVGRASSSSSSRAASCTARSPAGRGVGVTEAEQQIDVGGPGRMPCTAVSAAWASSAGLATSAGKSSSPRSIAFAIALSVRIFDPDRPGRRAWPNARAASWHYRTDRMPR